MTAAAAKSLQSCPTLCDPIDGSPAGSLVPGILQARTLEWVAISFSNAWKWKVKVKSESEVAQSCPTISDPMDCSLPGSSVHGIFQARVLEWGAIAFSLCMTRWKKKQTSLQLTESLSLILYKKTPLNTYYARLTCKISQSFIHWIITALKTSAPKIYLWCRFSFPAQYEVK